MDTLRLSDADREAATELLSEQYAVGRLSKDEFDERSDAVWSAKTRGDLAPVFADLPVRSPALPARVERRRSRRGFPVPLVPVLVVLLAIIVIAKLPFLLLGLAVWFCLIRPRWASHRSRHWAANGSGHGPGYWSAPGRAHHG